MRALWLVFVIGCTNAPPLGPGGGDDDGADGGVVDPTDSDGDGIPDQIEDHLMATFGPELRLAPDAIDQTRPASVDWYLPQVKLRFDHPNCPDDGSNLLDVGAVTFANLAAQEHHTKSVTNFCRHDSDAASLRVSSKRALEFFLQPASDAVHAGAPPAEWRAYVQVRPSSYKTAAYDLQVWLFYAYNDFIASANHEGDWEHMTISIAADETLVSVFYATHHDGFRVDDMTKLAFVDGHVVGYVADGSHATYDRAGTFNLGVVGVDDHTYEDGPRWQTWTNFMNVGDVGHIANDQTWAAYGGRWGEVGELEDTSGPTGPMFHGEWNTASEY
jgi:hypothetical protein